MAAYCGSRNAIAVSNATAALHIACLALDLGPGDFLWTTPNTFVASANCALYCGAGVDFVDIDPRTYNMGVSALAEKLEIAAKEGPAAEGRGPRPLCRPVLRDARYPRAGGSIRLSHHRGRLPRGRRRISGAKGRLLRLRRHHHFQLSPSQDHHHRRRRHGGSPTIRSLASASLICGRTASSALRSGLTTPGANRASMKSATVRGCTSRSSSGSITA